MERRKSKRHPIFVDIEVARPGVGRCCGIADNISNTGISIILDEGSVPKNQRSVILSFKAGTGNETLVRKMVARIIRSEGARLALKFSERDFISESTIRDLVRYQQRLTPLHHERTPDSSPISNRVL